mmetsp:Transcript_36874/g.113621  ORF Transcript_36874/g.113621 Transcript_36874/m.113621 type:complete len:200 (+) Transcript_36874:315-914(+)
MPTSLGLAATCPPACGDVGRQLANWRRATVGARRGRRRMTSACAAARRLRASRPSHAPLLQGHGKRVDGLLLPRGVHELGATAERVRCWRGRLVSLPRRRGRRQRSRNRLRRRRRSCELRRRQGLRDAAEVQPRQCRGWRPRFRSSRSEAKQLRVTAEAEEVTATRRHGRGCRSGARDAQEVCACRSRRCGLRRAVAET